MSAGLALALALQITSLSFREAGGEGRGEEAGPLSPDPCRSTDDQGRTFRVCFDLGNRLELTAGEASGSVWPERGGPLEARLAWRWRGDVRGAAGALEWLRDQTVLDARGLFAGEGASPRAARAALWRGVFIRHRTEPFLLLPGPRPIRLPFPFDIGVAFEAGGARWERERPNAVTVEVARAALLLDMGRGALRRASFGPEVAYEVSLSRGESPVQWVAPFSGGILDVRAESQDGLWAASLLARAAAFLRVPGGSRGRWSAALSLERVLVAVNDVPVALFAEAGGRGGSGEAALEASVGLRLDFQR